MTGFPDYYSMLGIDPSADPEVITAAYRALAKKYHPDTGATAGTASAERFEQVQQAYEVLRTPESRRRYDEELLAATERELDQHLAARQRMLAAGIGSGGLPPPPPPPGIGSIRPEPLGGPSSRPAVAETRRRSVLPFLVPGILALAVVAGGSFLLLSKPPEKPSVAVVTPAPAPPPQPAAAAVSEAPLPPSPPKPAPAPVFGSSTETAAAARPPEAPAPLVSDPVKVATETAVVAKPAEAPAREVTASITPEPAVADPAASPPTPKPKPKQAAKPAPKAVPEKRVARVEPEREPAPAPAEAEPPQFVSVAGPHKLVIFERQPGARATAWNVGVFKNARRCSRFGVKAIMHRMNETGRETPGEIWYQCQPV